MTEPQHVHDWVYAGCDEMHGDFYGRYTCTDSLCSVIDYRRFDD